MFQDETHHLAEKAQDHENHIWPGFVDTLCALLAVILFAFMLFIISYAYLANTLETKDKSLSLLMEKVDILKKKHRSQEKQAHMTQKELEQMKALYRQLQIAVAEKERELKGEKNQNQQTISQMQDQQKSLQEMVEELKILLEQKTKEAAGAPSVFFAKLKEALKDRPEVKVVGDRFVLPSEILFDLGSAQVSPKGLEKLKILAGLLMELVSHFPPDVSWVLRVDGHTDNKPIRSGSKFSSNLELSLARALAVVETLIKEGVPPSKLAAAGFSEYRPFNPGHPSEKDRRIELMIDQGY